MSHARRAGWLPPWMDPEHAPPAWYYLEVDEPIEPAVPEILEPVDEVPVFTLDLVQPLRLDGIRPGPIDWAAIRAYAVRVGFPLTAGPVDELAVHRRRRAARGTRPRRRRRYPRGA